jgi:hypothetical protein
MRTKFKIALAVSLLGSFGSSAQMPGGGSPGGMSAAMIKLFGDVKAFSAKAEVQVLDKDQKELLSTPMDFSLLDDKVRVQIDMTQMKNKDMPAGAAASLKQMGMAQIISIIRPDQKLVYLIYPDQKCFTTMPMPKEDAEAAAKTPKIARTALGKEAIDGHACVKNKVVMTDDKGQTIEATTWNATDLKDFPVQIKTTEKENTSVMRYTQVQFAKPDAKQFDAPAGYTKYADTQELMQGLMKKMLSGGETK